MKTSLHLPKGKSIFCHEYKRTITIVEKMKRSRSLGDLIKDRRDEN